MTKIRNLLYTHYFTTGVLDLNENCNCDENILAGWPPLGSTSSGSGCIFQSAGGLPSYLVGQQMAGLTFPPSKVHFGEPCMALGVGERDLPKTVLRTLRPLPRPLLDLFST